MHNGKKKKKTKWNENPPCQIKWKQEIVSSSFSLTQNNAKPYTLIIKKRKKLINNDKGKKLLTKKKITWG
jgi:hypothetical protein